MSMQTYDVRNLHLHMSLRVSDSVSDISLSRLDFRPRYVLRLSPVFVFESQTSWATAYAETCRVFRIAGIVYGVSVT